MKDNSRFVNPYNFISLPNKKAKAYLDEDKHYGVIHYSITTKTPLFIPNSSNDNAFGCKETDHKSYDFFSYTDLSNEKNVSGKYQEPVVPGSEMRGLVRNVYETLTDSCMGILNDDYPVKRISVAFNPGLLRIEEDGSLSLLKADSFRIDDDIYNPKKIDRYKDGDLIYFDTPKPEGKVNGKIHSFDKNKNNFNDHGYVLKWGFFINRRMKNAKNNYHAFKLSGDIVRNGLSKNEIKNKMNSIVTSYLEQPTVKPDDAKAYEAYKKQFELFLEGKREKYFPVNYSDKVKGLLSITPATFSKEVSSKSVADYAGVFAPCKDSLCPACDLFGKIGDNAKGSRIRFSDMYVEKHDSNKSYYVKDSITIDNLSSPKISNVDFYLERPKNATFWTYDYYVSNNKVYAYTGILRGRKYYWHHHPESISFNNVERTKLNKTIRPIKEGITFNGELYFDGISKKQLNQLIYILNTGKDGLGLKLGMGKPLGLGSVTCSVSSVEERKIVLEDSQLNYGVSSYDYSNVTYESAGLSLYVKKEFEKIAGLKAVPKQYEICYPKTTSDNDHGFEWFQTNHNSKIARSREEMKIKLALPKILDNDISLPQTKVERKNRNNSRNNNFHNNGNRKYKNWNN
jgi:CRISPR-associated protein (TIGR03986 family)